MPLLPMLCQALLSGLLSGQPASTPRPNILLIVGDDQAWTDFGFMGHPHIQTPNLDRMARSGRNFPHGYVTSSLCSPSLSALLTGRYPHQTRLTSNEPPLPAGIAPGARYKDPVFLRQVARMQGFLREQPRLPALLQDAGYLTLQTGKWWMGDPKASGFTHAMTHGLAEKGGRHGDAGLEIGRTTLEPIIRFLDEAQAGGKPFFIWYAPMLPHQPHNPPERLLAKYRDKTPSIHLAKYWAMCEWFDESVGQLQSQLEKRGMTNNTLVAHLSDNGWIQDPDKPRFMPDSKQSQYDTGLRTPILLHQPGTLRPARLETPVSSLDLTTTLLLAAGIQPPVSMAGINLLADPVVKNRGPVFGECFQHDAADLERPAASLTYRFMVDGPLKLVVPNPATVQAEKKPGRGLGKELYDLAADPLEEKNLLATRAEDAARLEKKLDAWWKP
ncbi:MAG: sulfatase [Planctomycetota bacterium]|nr:MAG: sulfatase [Planctomycetota bacterium]